MVYSDETVTVHIPEEWGDAEVSAFFAADADMALPGGLWDPDAGGEAEGGVNYGDPDPGARAGGAEG